MVNDLPKVSADPRDSFPHCLYEDVNNVFSLLPNAKISPIGLLSVKVDNEDLEIPYRVYYPELRPSDIELLSNNEKLIVHCVYTRHHDGFVRQNHLEYLFNADLKWVVPFVLQLVGEYVVEIIEAIHSNIKALNATNYSNFAEANNEFIEQKKSQIVSYWNCYYRGQFPRFTEYPGYLVADKLNWWHPSDLRRVRAR